MEGWPILRSISVHGSEERGGLVQFYNLHKKGEHINKIK